MTETAVDLRDRFAMAWLTGVAANPRYFDEAMEAAPDRDERRRLTVEQAFRVADEALAQRQR